MVHKRISLKLYPLDNRVYVVQDSRVGQLESEIVCVYTYRDRWNKVEHGVNDEKTVQSVESIRVHR